MKAHNLVKYPILFIVFFISGCSTTSVPQFGSSPNEIEKVLSLVKAHPQQGLDGHFKLRIKSTAKVNGVVYLNTELDHKDERNLSVKFHSRTLGAFRQAMGQEAQDYFLNKYVEIKGKARRTKIRSRQRGRPVSSQVNYRTFIHVNSIEQVSIDGVQLKEESNPNGLISHANVYMQDSCFRSKSKDYDALLASYSKRKKRQLKTDKKVKVAVEQFEAHLTRNDFNTYKSRLVCQTFAYDVDGVMVDGYIVRPKQLNGEKLPVLIYNRGGNGYFGAVHFENMFDKLFPIADQGFVIIGSQYRGSLDRDSEYKDEFGGTDIRDVTTLLDFIPNIKGADAKRIGMFGWSRGGMQTFVSSRQNNSIKAIASIAGVSDQRKELEFRPAMERVFKRRIPNYIQNKEVELNKRSVLKWVDELNPDVPILLLHGEDDKRVSVRNSIDLAKELVRLEHPHKLMIFPGDNHGLTKNKSNWIEEISEWFHLYL